MTKDQYIKKRIKEIGSHYKSHSTSKTDWDNCIKLEVGTWPIFSKGSSAHYTLELLLECKYSKTQMVDKLNHRFPKNQNSSRPQRVFNCFSGGKCRNITEYRKNGVLGLKWDQYKFFNQSGEWVEDKNDNPTIEEQNNKFDELVKSSLRDNSEARKHRLKIAQVIPETVKTETISFCRNPDVVAEVLLRAEGICEHCNNPAPFTKIRDGTPYLEVHHIIQLSSGGEDTVENSLAVCPNCHRYLHYGISDT